MNVLFVCTANSCRSQMAEAWARHLYPADWTVQSAGLLTYRITAKTRAIMAEVGLDMDGQRPKLIDEVDLDGIDVVVTLSEEATRYLPELPPHTRHLKRPIDDPMSATGDAETVRAAFRRGRDEVRAIVQSLLDEAS